ncbi:MAG: hypothetical protein KDN22_25775 [Verrucomicrobiae bacterium]|nr:hypothetical protein [Verrucomicrobiae bacterium]
MAFTIAAIDLYMRETPSPRMNFFIGKGKAVFPKHLRAISEVHMTVMTNDGRSTFGCSADWPSVGWLDKRDGITPEQKLVGLLDLVQFAANVYLGEGGNGFTSPFALWHACYLQILAEGRRRGLEDLSSAFASSMLERALIDGVCRLENASFLAALKQDLLQIRAGDVHPSLANVSGYSSLPDYARSQLAIRHTVGLADPLVDADLSADDRVDDGEPETLEEYIRQDGLTHFKIKVSGDTEEAMDRLCRIWSIIVNEDVSAPYVTLDCNEAYADLEELDRFVAVLGDQLPELFHRIALIEQPLPRSMQVDASASSVLRRIAARKPLIIDEGDGTVEAFREAQSLGYSGVSHKNCKGVFKSLVNRMLCDQWNASGVAAMMSAEDLTHMPIVSLHQDFATVAALGLDNAERNAHHYFYGVSHLTEDERASVAGDYPGVYTERRGEWFIDIRSGEVDCSSILSAVGFGVLREPDWSAMTAMGVWNRNLAENS